MNCPLCLYHDEPYSDEHLLKVHNIQKHEHDWIYYDGALGYESYVCKTCKIDINDWEKERLTEDKEEAEARADLTRKYER